MGASHNGADIRGYVFIRDIYDFSITFLDVTPLENILDTN